MLWLWSRLAATAPIHPLAWEPPYAAGAAEEMAKRQKKEKKNCSLDKMKQQRNMFQVKEKKVRVGMKKRKFEVLKDK